MATKPGLRNRNTGGYKTLDLLDQLEEESKQREEREWQRQERQYQDRLRQYGQFQAEQNAEIAKGIKMTSPLEIANRAQQERVEERRQAVNTGSNLLTPEIEAGYQRRNGGGNGLSPYQVYMQNLVAQMPKVTAPEETRSNRDLRLDANRQALLAAGTNNMAADWATGKQNATTPAAQMLGLSDQGVRERMYDPTYTTRLRAIEQQNEAQQAKAVQARNQYVTIRAQRQAEEAWSKYAPYRSNPDFIEKSKPDLTNENRIYYSMAHSDEAIEENGANVNAAAYATDDEKQMYYYLWHTQGKDAADAYYYNYVETAASARKALDVELRTAARVENNNFFQDVKDSFKSVGTNAISGIGIVDLAFQNIGAEVSNLLGLGDPEINYYSLAQMPGIVTDSIRSNVAKKIAASTPGMTIGKAENAVNIASFLYETGMSMADSSAMVLMNLAGVPEWLTLGGMGAAAGTRAVRDAKERGATDWQALAFGISSAVMEALFEKMSLDQILKPSDGHFFTNAAKQTFVEGSEEFFTTWGNTVMDQIVMGDKSELFDKQRQLMEQGYSQKDALKAAALEWCIQIGTDALGGLISGFGMGGAKELGTGLGVFARDAARDLEGGLVMTDLQNMAAASQQEARLRQQYEQQPNAPQPQPLTIPSQETVSARQTNPLGYAMNKAQNGETVTGNDAKAILNDPQAVQTLRDAGVLADTIRPGAEGRAQIQQAVQALAEQRAQDVSMPAAAAATEAATEAERAANPYDDLLSQIWGEQAQERTAPTTATETRTETNDPAWDRIVADLEAQRARAAEQRAQERTAAPTTTQERTQREEEVSTPPVPRAQETASEAPTEGNLRLPEQRQRQEAPPVPRLTLRSGNDMLNENRQEGINGQQTETAAPAETAEQRRAREESAAFRKAADEAAGSAVLDRAEWRAGLGRLLQAVRNSRDANNRQQRRSEAARITNQAEAGNPERLSARDLGAPDGTDEKTAVRVDDKILGSQWQQTVADYAKRGITLTAISGQMQLNKIDANGNYVQARAYISADGKTIVVQADNPRLSWQQLLAHEELHRLIKENSGYRKRVMDALLADKKIRPYLSQIIDRYAEAYHGVDPTATDEDIIEELLADYRAGFDMLDPLGTNRTLAKVTKAAAKDIRAVEKTPRKQYETNGGKPAPADIEENFAEAKNSVEPPYRLGTKAAQTFEDGLNEQARSVYDMFLDVRNASLENTAVMTVGSGKKAHPKRVTIADRFLTAADWNDQVKSDPEFAQAAKNIFSVIPADIRKNARLNDDGTISETEFEKRFKMARSLVQRLVDALPKGVVGSTVELGGKSIQVTRGRVTASVGGEEYRRALIAEKRRLYEEGSLPTRAIGTLSHDNWGAMGFLATNTKTIASGDFTTFCPQMYFNDGCWYCYRRAALTSGVNNKLTAETVWYAGEILQLRQADIDRLNQVGGLRIQSFGDWMTQYSTMLADMLIDAEKVGLQIKIITKEPSMIDTVALLKEQGLGKSLYFNLSADYTIEKRGKVDNTNTSDALPMNPERPFLRRENESGEEETWWKRALTVQEANEYRKMYPWVNTRIVATNLDEFIRGLSDPTVDVVTGYHGDIRQQERVSSETGETLLDVEPLGDAGMPRFAYDRKTGEWTLEYEGKSRYQKQLAQRIQEEGLEREYYTKSCCIFGRCAKCQGKCGSYARSFAVKNATNRDQESVKYWQREMESGVDNPLLESQQEGKASTEIAMQDVQEMEEIPDTFIDSAIGERVKYSYDIKAEQDFEPLRDEDGNIKYVYKAFYVMKDEDGIGRLYPPMISNVSDEEKKKVKGAVSGTQRNIYTPVGIVLTADVGMLARYKKDTVDEDGTLHKAGELVRNTLGRLAVTNDKGSGTLAFRPGWHLGEWPDAKQFNKDSKIYGKRAAMPDQLVFAKCEIAGSVDYQLEAMRHGVKKNGKYDRTQAGLPRVPVNGYYKYRTNPDPDTAPWYITGQMRVVEILTDEQCREICAQYGVEMSPRESGHDIDLEEYGLKAGPVDRETNIDRFLKSEKSKANERELETALSDPEYSEAYAPRDIDFDDPEILKEFERNRQDSEYYRGQYQQKYGGSASIEIDPEVAAQFSPEALALREETKGRRRNPFRERKVSRVRSNTYENSGLFDEVEAQMDEADESNYEYDPISEKRSMNEARKRLKDFDGEVEKLSQPDYDWGGSDLDTAMGILHRYRTEGRATGDYTDFWNWSKTIQKKGTKGGQFIQAFAKYTRTGTGTAAKAAATIHEQNQLTPAQRKQVQGHVERLLNGMPEEAQGAAGDAMKQAKGQKEPTKKQDGKVDKKKLDAETRRRKDAERLIREISRLFERQQTHGEPVEDWLKLTGEELAKKIASRFNEPKNRAQTTMQIILKDLVGFAEEHALPERQKAETKKRTAIDIITDYLNNRDAYGAAWAEAQGVLRSQYADDQEKLDALEGFLGANIAYNAEGTDRTMLDAILQSADVLGISERRILELASAGATRSTIDRIGDELVSQVKERMGADWQDSYEQQLKDAVRRHITGIALSESASEQALRLGRLETAAAKELDINLQKILTESRLTKQDASRRVADYLIRELGIPSSDAAIAAQRISEAFMDELAARADRRLQQMFGDKTPKAKEQRDKLLDLLRLGGFTNANVEDAVVDALGIGKLSREEQKRITGDMARFGETLDAMMDDDLDGLRQLIREQAAVRNTPLSRQAEKTLAGETDAEYLRDFAMAQLASIAGDYAELSPGAKISTFQTISHLLNARTALRNLTSNQVFDLVDSAANNVALIPDMVIGAITGKRTVGANKSWFSDMKRSGAIQGLRRNALEVRLDVAPDERQKSKYGTAGRRTNSMANSNAFGRILSHLEEIMGYELNSTDEFHKGSVRGETLESLARLVERGDITQEQANAWAEEEALYRSFQDDTLVGNIMGELKTLLNVIGFGDSGKKNSRGRTIHDFGLGDLVVKYTQVPGALIHRGIEYSPLGYAKMLYDLAIAKDSLVRTQKRGEDVANAQRKLALDIGRATTGSGLITLFAVLAKAGLLRRDDDDKDKNAKALHAAQGLSGTQLNLTALGRWISGEDAEPQDGDVLADIGFLEPLDSLMTIATLLAKDKDLTATDVGVKSLDGVWKAISNTSAMQTISNIIQTVQYHDEENDLPLYFQIPIEIASDSISGFIPSPVRQLAQATDTTYRDQYRSQNINDQIRDKAMNAVPGLRQKLAPKITPLGEDKTYQKPVLNYLNATLNPGNISVYKASGVVDELNRVYGETEDAKIWPERNAPYSFTANDEKWTLTPDERTQYQRTRGQTTAKFINDLMAADWYKKASASDQAKWLNWIGNFSNYVAKKEMLGARGVEYASDTYEKYYKTWTEGASPADVVKESDAKSIALSEAGFSQEMKDEVKDMNRQDFRDYLQGQDLTDEEKLTALGAIIGTEMTTKEGNPSQWANVNTAVKDGNSVDTVLGWVQDGLLDDYLKYRDGDVKKAKVDVDTYMTYRVDTGKMDAKDETGKTVSGLKKQRVVSYIDSLDLTAAQKDALYLDAGYSESGLADTPWHKSSGGGKGSGSYAPARIPTLRLPDIPNAEKPSSGLRIRAAAPVAQAPRSGLRIRAK